MKYSNTVPLQRNFSGEQAILNLLLTNASLAKEAILTLKSETFYVEPHKIIYETIIDVYEIYLGANAPLVIT